MRRGTTRSPARAGSAFRVVSALLSALGCGDKKVEPVARVTVSGAVKIDVLDVKSGTITFDAMYGQAPGAIMILDGRYEGLAPVGVRKVTIHAILKRAQKEWLNRQGKPVVDGPGSDEIQAINLLSERYNTKSEISKDVTAVGPNEFNFPDPKSQ